MELDVVAMQSESSAMMYPNYSFPSKPPRVDESVPLAFVGCMYSKIYYQLFFGFFKNTLKFYSIFIF
jgi:hypothetical protein